MFSRGTLSRAFRALSQAGSAVGTLRDYGVRRETDWSAGPLAFDDERAHALEFLLLLEGSRQAEPDERGVGVPPDALRALRVLDAPLEVRREPGRAAEAVAVVVPRPA